MGRRGAALAALVVAVVAGLWAGRAAAPERDAQPAATALVRIGDATIRVPPAWRELAGARRATTTVLAPSARSPERVIVALAPADDRSLVPGPLRDLVAEVPDEPVASRLAGYRAWRYPALRGRVPGQRIDVTVLPSTGGALGIACASSAGAPAACASSIASVRFGRAAVLAPSPELAFRLRLPHVLAALDPRRVSDRRELRRARVAGARADAARRLARDHRAAAAALRPLAGGADGARLVSRLSGAARAYDALAGAAAGRSPARFAAARRTVGKADAAVAGAVSRFTGLTEAAPVERRPIAGPAATRTLSPAVPIVLTVLLLALAVALSVPRLRSRRRAVPPSGPAASPRRDPPPTTAAPTVVRASHRPPPPPPPPARTAGRAPSAAGRWDAPPPSRPDSAPPPRDDHVGEVPVLAAQQGRG